MGVRPGRTWFSRIAFALALSTVLPIAAGAIYQSLIGPFLLAGLALGMLSFIFSALAERWGPALLASVVLVAAAVIIPGLLRACCAANEPNTIGALRAINSGQAAYASSCAHGGYATTLADLFRPPTAGGSGFIRPDLSSDPSVLAGYIITLEKDRAAGVTDVGEPAKTCNAAESQPASSYFASASPTSPGGTGTRYFATDARGVIFQSYDAPIPNPIPSNATPAQ